MNVISVKNCIWVNAENTVFNCFVQFSAFPNEVQFACAQFDPLPHSQEIWQRALAGEFGPIAEFVPPPEIKVTPITPASGEIPGSIL